jgi:hypothetical protein
VILAGATRWNGARMESGGMGHLGNVCKLFRYGMGFTQSPEGNWLTT